MKRFIAVVLALALSSTTLTALARDHRDGHGSNGQQHHWGDNQGRGDHRGWDRGNQGRGDHRGWDRGNQGRGDHRGWDRDNQGRNDARSWDRDNQGRNDARSWDRHRDHNDHAREYRHHDNRWNHRGWDRRDWRRSWNHGWSGSRYRSSTRYYFPRGYTARHWSIGVRLPSVFYGASYYVNYTSYGLAPPPWGCQWIRIDSDVVLVDLASGEILDVLYGFYY